MNTLAHEITDSIIEINETKTLMSQLFLEAVIVEHNKHILDESSNLPSVVLDKKSERPKSHVHDGELVGNKKGIYERIKETIKKIIEWIGTKFKDIMDKMKAFNKQLLKIISTKMAQLKVMDGSRRFKFNISYADHLLNTVPKFISFAGNISTAEDVTKVNNGRFPDTEFTNNRGLVDTSAIKVASYLGRLQKTSDQALKILDTLKKEGVSLSNKFKELQRVSVDDWDKEFMTKYKLHERKLDAMSKCYTILNNLQMHALKIVLEIKTA